MAFSSIIFGASGLVGRACLDGLLRNPDCKAVKVFVRRKLEVSDEKLTQIITDYSDPIGLANDLKTDKIYCCLGTTIRKAGSKSNFQRVDRDLVVKLARLSLQAGVEHWSVISSIGADAKSPSFYLRTKAEMENELLSLPFPSLHILRPSLLDGRRKEFRPGEQISLRLSRLLGRLLPERIRPIHVARLADAMISASMFETYGKRILESEALQCGKNITQLLQEDSSRQAS